MIEFANLPNHIQFRNCDVWFSKRELLTLQRIHYIVQLHFNTSPTKMPMSITKIRLAYSDKFKMISDQVVSRNIILLSLMQESGIHYRKYYKNGRPKVWVYI